MSRVPVWARQVGVVLWWSGVVVWFGVQVLRRSGAERLGATVVFVLMVAQAVLYLVGYSRPKAKPQRPPEQERMNPPADSN
jgi:hypothetical protein